jgi:hypothetical protein
MVARRLLRPRRDTPVARCCIRAPSSWIWVIDNWRQPIQASAWYDIRSYTPIMELPRDAVGGRDNEYFCKAGAASAQRLLQMGVYQQLEYFEAHEVGRP